MTEIISKEQAYDVFEDEEEHFEDFTTASDWEVFIARIEQILCEWSSKKIENCDLQGYWIVLNEIISFSDCRFNFTYYKDQSPILKNTTSEDVKLQNKGAKNSDRSTSSNFPSYLKCINDEETSEFPPNHNPHVLGEYFCLREYAVIHSKQDIIDSESKFKLVLSSACIALNNTSSSFPIFVQFGPQSRQYFCGIAEYFGIRTNFQMIKLKNLGKQFHHLNGLLDMFKGKIGHGVSLSYPVNISAHFFYYTETWHDDFTFENLSTDGIYELEKKFILDDEIIEEGIPHMDLLPFGCTIDPFSSLKLVTGWPHLTEDVIVDSPTYSDLDPNQAPDWFFSLLQDRSCKFHLAENLDKFWKLSENNSLILSSLKNVNSSSSITGALDRITGDSLSQLSLNRALSNVNTQLNIRSLERLGFRMEDDRRETQSLPLEKCLAFLFPDSQDKPDFPYPKVFTTLSQESTSVKHNLFNSKSAPVDSLVWRLTLLMQAFAGRDGGTQAIAQIWQELILEMEHRWENSIAICGLESGTPDCGTCLINQKLQMLNCCIEKKRLREQMHSRASSPSPPPQEEVSHAENEDNSEEDEFYDCEEEEIPSANASCPTVLHKAIGRLKELGTLKLLKTGEQLYVPVTQDGAPMTEDRFEEQTRFLVGLGDNTDGMEQRAKVMSATLVSDVQAFKAANPGSVLEDFVRWYSPRDWIANENGDENAGGELSARMKIPGNLWQEVWDSTIAIPARRQKRLFDDTKEAETILSWMSQRTIRDVCELISPVLVQICVFKLLSEAESSSCKNHVKIPSTLFIQCINLTRRYGEDALKNQCKPSTRFGRTLLQEEGDNDGLTSFSRCEDTELMKKLFWTNLEKIEREICEIRSFQLKFPNYENNEKLPVFTSFNKIDSKSKTLKEQVHRIFQQELAVHDLISSVANEFKFNEPKKKVFLLKHVPSNSRKYSFDGKDGNPLPQRMSSTIQKDEIIICGTFSIQADLI